MRSTTSTRAERAFRWIGRIWSLGLLVFTVMRVFTPDPYATEPITAIEILMLSFWGVAILALVSAWRWEKAGAIAAIVLMFLREAAWVVIYKGWIINFLIVWAAILPPAIAFLAAYRLKARWSAST